MKGIIQFSLVINNDNIMGSKKLAKEIERQKGKSEGGTHRE